MPTALQIAQGREIPLSQGLVMALVKDTPLLASLDFRLSTTTKFISLAVTALPTAGAFVNYGEGFNNSEAQLELREFDCSLVGGQVRAERITAQKWDQTHVASGYTWFDLQMETKMAAQGIELEKQIIQGTVYDEKGFPGLKELLPYIAGNVVAPTETTAKYLHKRSVIDATGSTASTASSVYAIIEDPINGVQGVIGSDGQATAGELFALSEMLTSNEAPDSNAPTKKLIHDLQQFWGHIGLSLCGFNQSPNSVVPVQFGARRIANLTAQTGKGLTDALMSKLERSFGNGKRPTKFIMGTRSGEQLAASRQATAVNYVMGMSGDASQATFNTYPPPPDNFKGIPIIYADNAIGETEAIEA